MSVGCGAFNDTDEVQGLAHLAEHMITRGSKKYPSTSLGQSLAQVGGQFNAFTSSEQTCFYFEVSAFAKNTISGCSSILDAALPVFSALFTCPLLKGKFLGPEIQAVDDEHTGNLSEEEKIIFHSFRLLANPHHKFSRFATGNYDSLSNISPKRLRRAVKDHIEHNFVTENMSLVLKGPQTILQLKKLALANFQDLRTSQNFSNFKSREELDVFRDLDPNMIILKISSMQKVRVCFPIYLLRREKNYNATASLLCNLLGEESPQSLSSILTSQRKWASSLYVFIQKLYSKDEVLIVEVVPTKLGWNHILELTNEIISYALSTIADSNDKALQALLQHIQVISEFKFNSQIPSTSHLDEVLDYAERLNLNPADSMNPNFINAFELFDDLEEAATCLRSMISVSFLKSKIKIQVLIPNDMSFSQLSPAPEQIDKYFKFQYVVSDLRGMSSKTNRTSGGTLPGPTTMFSDKCLSGSNSRNSVGLNFKVRDIAFHQELPQLSYFDQSCEFWKIRNNSEGESKDSIVSVLIKYPHMKFSASNVVLFDLLVELAYSEVRTTFYECEKVGCFWGLFSNTNRTNSILVSTSGPQFAVEHILTETFCTIRHIAANIQDIPYEQLKKARVSLRKRYVEQLESHDIKKILSVICFLLEECIATPGQKIKALEELTGHDLKRFGDEILNTPQFRSFLTQGSDLTFCLDNAFVSKIGAKASGISDPSSVLINTGSLIAYNTATTKCDSMAIVMHYTQIGLRSDTESFELAKLYQFLLNSTAIEELRMKKGISYSVFSGIRMFQRTFGIYLLIPSVWNECDSLSNLIELFQQILEEMIRCYTDQDFQAKLVIPFLESMSRDDSDNSGTSLFADLQPHCGGSGMRPSSEQFNQHWNQLNQVLNATYNFNAMNCEEPLDPDAIKRINRLDFLRFIRAHMSINSPTRSVLVLRSEPQNGVKGQRRLLFATELVKRLKDMGIAIDESEVNDMLLECLDQDEYTDIFKILLKSSLMKRHRLQMKKLQLVGKIGGILPSIAAGLSKISLKSTRSEESAPLSSVPHIECSDYRQFQRQCSTASSISMSERYEKLMKIEETQNDY